MRHLDVLAASLRATRQALAEWGPGPLRTVGGDCGVELAPVSHAVARHGADLAVVWFDAHADLNTPASSPSGGFHGMVLRTLLGQGPAALLPPPDGRLDARRLVLAECARSTPRSAGSSPPRACRRCRSPRSTTRTG
ncbi:arginase family protein [Streptomyces albulus]|nr:arginase family protein [Streptomyces noursei]